MTINRQVMHTLRLCTRHYTVYLFCLQYSFKNSKHLKDLTADVIITLILYLCYAHFLLSQAYLKLGMYQNALSDCEWALKVSHSSNLK